MSPGDALNLAAGGNPIVAARAVSAGSAGHDAAASGWALDAHDPVVAAAAELLSLARGQGTLLAVAESCTGGRVAAALTAIPGASDVFLGGVVAYANAVKERALAVPAATLMAHGAVSAATAMAMAQGVRIALGADLTVACTGIAGPTGGSAEKPVGTLWIAVADAEGAAAHRFDLVDRDRATFQTDATALALRALRQRLLGLALP